MNNTCILQVEDDANDVFLLQRAFLELGVVNPVQVATDGQMAVDYLAGNGRYANRSKYPMPGLVLLDLKLPRQSGREVLQWIRAQPMLRRIIVIVLTSAQYVGDVGLAYDLGANSFIVKPFDSAGYLRMARLLKEWWLGHNQFAPLTDAGWTPSLPASPLWPPSASQPSENPS